MKKVNNLRTHICIVVIVFFLSSWKQSPKLKAKVTNAIAQTFEIVDFKERPILVGPTDSNKSSIDLQDFRLFKIEKENKLVGYGYLGETASMKRMFDYLILFNVDLSIKKAKVLIYREEHGRQIGSQRWLKQFIGLTVNDTPMYGEGIDAISGATISANSMTLAVGKVLKSLKELKRKNLLK